MKLFNIVVIFASILILFASHVQFSQATRILHENGQLPIEEGLLLQSLQRGAVPSSGASSCTNIPGSGGSTSCPLG
ncbi:hypothetical protein ACJRO7_031905 [Eucalyptus globulus]|uniref:Transmembrane protein n=1 Tax=Eucalyptus globulus TaxID=34317 RepID=A0ABD3JRX1_EUCGL